MRQLVSHMNSEKVMEPVTLAQNVHFVVEKTH